MKRLNYLLISALAALMLACGTSSRGPTPLERAEQQARHTEDAPSGSWTAPLGAVLGP